MHPPDMLALLVMDLLIRAWTVRLPTVNMFPFLLNFPLLRLYNLKAKHFSVADTVFMSTALYF